jgi:septal ring factor EnvC (AmiA/AmiB activator)
MNSIFLQNKIRYLKELYSDFDVTLQEKIKINNYAQDGVLNNSYIKFNKFEKKVNILKKNRKELDKSIENKKKQNKNIRRKIIKLEKKLTDLKQF